MSFSVNKQELISVVIPAYNSSLFIRETVHSALMQIVLGSQCGGDCYRRWLY